MSNIFITSDTHFGHDREFIWGPRGFMNHIDHDNKIIENCNQVVDMIEVMTSGNIMNLDIYKKIGGLKQ